jgi:hypothetical protein
MDPLSMRKHIHFQPAGNQDCTCGTEGYVNKAICGGKANFTYDEATDITLCACGLGVGWVIAGLMTRY